MQEVVSKAVLHGLYIITVQSGDRRNGMTAAWVSQVSMRPLMLMVSIAPVRYTHRLIEAAGYFAVNTLPEGRQDLAKHFGFKSGRHSDKLEGVPFYSALNGSPVLKEAVAYFECSLSGMIPAGDHSLIIGEVVSAELIKEAAPLVFRWEDYF